MAPNESQQTSWRPVNLYRRAKGGVVAKDEIETWEFHRRAKGHRIAIDELEARELLKTKDNRMETRTD